MSGTYYTCLKSDRRNDSVNGSAGGHLIFCMIIFSYFLRFEHAHEHTFLHLKFENGRRTYTKIDFIFVLRLN